MITVLTPSNGRRLTKLITRGGDGWETSAFARAKHFDAIDLDLDGIDELFKAIKTLSEFSSAAVIRGRLIDGRSQQGIRRTVWDDLDNPASFESVPRPWMCADFDKLSAPDHITSDDDRVRWLISQLPAEFHDVTCVYQWSSSAGLAGWSPLKCHIWFWLSSPIGDDELRARSVGQGWPIDHALHNPVQLHYTAAPIFEGCTDPLDRRVGLLRGDRDEVTLTPWSPPVVPRIERTSDAAGTGAMPGASFEARLAAIGPDYHEPIRSAIACYVATTPDPDFIDLKERLIARIWEAPPGVNKKTDYTDDKYLDGSIEGARRKFTCVSRSPISDTRRAYYAAKKKLKGRK